MIGIGRDCEMPMETIPSIVRDGERLLLLRVQLVLFLPDPLCVMMSFDNAEILNLVIVRERAPSGKTP